MRSSTGEGLGRLVLVATPIGNLADLSPRARQTLEDADIIAAEDTRRARALLSAVEVSAKGRVRSVHGHNEAREADRIADDVAAGAVVAYVSDAGMPGVSDPGEILVRSCTSRGLPVEVVPGPSAGLSALVISGLPTARYRFEGFLPRKGRPRRERLASVAGSDDTVVVYESPQRTATTLDDLVESCGPQRPGALVRELTKLHEQTRRGDLAQLAASAHDDPPRGEVVIVVGPADQTPVAASDAEVDAAAHEALASGLSGRDAARAVEERLGIAHRRAYEAVNRARSDDAR